LQATALTPLSAARDFNVDSAETIALGCETARMTVFVRESPDSFHADPRLRIRRYDGPREDLRSMFELAEDSGAELDSYIGAGEVLVAMSGDQIIGHVQMTETGGGDELEIKNIAVLESHQRRGVGRALMAAAIGHAQEQGRSTVVVATAAADIDNLRFYQRLGFRMRSIERDAFTPASGYEEGMSIDGIELRDRVWLDLRIA